MQTNVYTCIYVHVLCMCIRLCVIQGLVAINRAISNKTLASRPTLVDAFTTAKAKNGRLHFLGLVSTFTISHSMLIIIWGYCSTMHHSRLCVCVCVCM